MHLLARLQQTLVCHELCCRLHAVVVRLAIIKGDFVGLVALVVPQDLRDSTSATNWVVYCRAGKKVVQHMSRHATLHCHLSRKFMDGLVRLCLMLVLVLKVHTWSKTAWSGYRQHR